MRINPDPTGSERVTLAHYLDSQRATLLGKTDGLTARQLVMTHPPSALTLAGLLYHLALVEETWMEVRFTGLAQREPWTAVDWETDPDWEFHTATMLDPDDVRERYLAACGRSRQVVDGTDDLGEMSVRPRRDGRHFSLRWVLLHLIEETARHAGHADLLREAIDGAVGE